MEAKELMIGDWCRIESIPAVFCLYKMKAEAFRGAFNFDPIPLTKEILAANGIKFQYRFPWWQYADPFGNPEQYEVHINEVTTVIVVYVHQLQHALRLCGLNDIADNFKVE